jgi:hypothetical protein
MSDISGEKIEYIKDVALKILDSLEEQGVAFVESQAILSAALSINAFREGITLHGYCLAMMSMAQSYSAIVKSD